MINVILPINFSKNYNGGADLSRAITGLLPSLDIYARDQIRKLIIITPGESLEILKSEVLNQNFQMDIDFISDESIVKNLDYDNIKFGLIPAWFRQQILKISSYKLFNNTNPILILDSDVLLVKPLRKLLEENSLPYGAMGFNNFPQWYKGSLFLIDENIQLSDLGDMSPMGVTPQILIPEILAHLVKSLSDNNMHWIDFLNSNITDFDCSWSEYSLYWLTYWMHYRDEYKYHPVSMYKFIETQEELNNFSLTENKSYFIVLQSAKLNLFEHSFMLKGL